eukprot:364901-Chlamydomonas_euryale.AAC.1
MPCSEAWGRSCGRPSESAVHRELKPGAGLSGLLGPTAAAAAAAATTVACATAATAAATAGGAAPSRGRAKTAARRSAATAKRPRGDLRPPQPGGRKVQGKEFKGRACEKFRERVQGVGMHEAQGKGKGFRGRAWERFREKGSGGRGMSQATRGKAGACSGAVTHAPLYLAAGQVQRKEFGGWEQVMGTLEGGGQDTGMDGGSGDGNLGAVGQDTGMDGGS